MEIKDVNNLSMLLGLGKSPAPSGESGGDFLNLLDSTKKNVDASLSVKSEFRAKSPAPSKEVAAKEKTDREGKVFNGSTNKNASSRKTEVKVKKENFAENDVSAAKETTSVIPQDAVEGDSAIDVSFLAGIPLIEFVHPEAGELVSMSGAELMQKIISGEIPLFKNRQILDSVMPQVQVSETKGFSVEGMELVETSEVVDINVKAVKSDAKVEYQATDIKSEDITEASEIFVAHKGVKTDLSVKEEKSVELPAKNLLADTKVVDAAIAQVDVDADVQEQNPLLVQDEAANAPEPVQANHLVHLAKEVVAKSEEVNVVAGSISNEAVAANRLDAAFEADKASYKEVYKGLGKEVIEQIKVNITKSSVKGIDKIDIQLKPQELGSLEIRMQIGKDGKIQAHIIASKSDAAEMLQKEANTLQKALSDAGFNLDESSLSFSFREEQMAKNQHNSEGLKDFMGKALDNEEELINANLFQESSWDGKSALNIRV